MNEKQEKKKFVDEMMYLLTAPHVFHNEWGSDFPKSTLEETTTQRLIHSREILEKKECSDYEAAMYLSTMSMQSPMSHETYKMYMYAFKKGLPDKFKILIEKDKWIEKDSELFENEMVDYKILKQKIFKSQMGKVQGRSKK